MKLLVINNLTAGYQDGAIYDFVRSFMQEGDEACVRAVDSSSSFESILKDAECFDMVVAAGGDGTVTSICDIMRYRHIPVLVYPAGTANLLAQNIFQPSEPHALSQIARNPKLLDFDLGEMEFANGRKGFAIMAGCGYDATIMKDAKATKKYLGPLAYLQAAFANPTPQKSDFRIVVDGREYHYSGVGVVIANFSNIQFDISVTGKNLPRDGKLDVVVLATNTALDLIPSALAAAMDQGKESIAESDAIHVLHGAEITVHADPPMNIQFDGDVVQAQSPFTARILPHAVTLALGSEAYEKFKD